MIPINDRTKEEKLSIVAVVVTIVACLLMVVLVAVYYSVMTNMVPDSVMNYFVPKVLQVQVATKNKNSSLPSKTAKTTTPEFTTKVMRYVFPQALPTDIKSGYCLAESIAQPFRLDSFRCQVGNSIYDPCFSNDKKDSVVCQINPLVLNLFLIKLTKPLPSVGDKKIFQNNWAWFVELEDGTICSPYTGTRPLIDKEPAYYGCKASVKGDLDVLIGDLTPGIVWTAKRTIVEKDNVGTGWNTKSSGPVRIKTVWQ